MIMRRGCLQLWNGESNRGTCSASARMSCDWIRAPGSPEGSQLSEAASWVGDGVRVCGGQDRGVWNSTDCRRRTEGRVGGMYKAGQVAFHQLSNFFPTLKLQTLATSGWIASVMCTRPSKSKQTVVWCHHNNWRWKPRLDETTL